MTLFDYLLAFILLPFALPGLLLALVIVASVFGLIGLALYVYLVEPALEYISRRKE